MLVLTRKLQQQIKIGDQITVTILRVKGSTVRIGVQAPRDVRVIRGELPQQCATPGEADAHLETPVVLELNLTPDQIDVDAAQAAVPSPAAELPRPTHLPLKKLRHRRGAAPLKQMVAACALAK